MPADKWLLVSAGMMEEPSLKLPLDSSRQDGAEQLPAVDVDIVAPSLDLALGPSSPSFSLTATEAAYQPSLSSSSVTVSSARSLLDLY